MLQPLQVALLLDFRMAWVLLRVLEIDMACCWGVLARSGHGVVSRHGCNGSQALLLLLHLHLLLIKLHLLVLVIS